MKALVAATCVAVLAAVSYFFWGEYSTYRERAHTEVVRAENQRAKNEAERFAATATQNAADEARSGMLGDRGCEQAAEDLLFAVEMNTVRTASEVPTRLANDIRICVGKDMLHASTVKRLEAVSFFRDIPQG